MWCLYEYEWIQHILGKYSMLTFVFFSVNVVVNSRNCNYCILQLDMMEAFCGVYLMGVEIDTDSCEDRWKFQQGTY